MNTIHFYSVNAEYGCFSNFSPHPIVMDGIHYKTTEHYFQAQKFLEKKHRQRIISARTPMDAATLGRDRNMPMRKDWNSRRDDVMLTAIRAKVAQHSDVRELLLSTGNAVLVEHTANDSYWADGGDGSGHNRLGKILMRVRQEMQ